MSVSRRQEVFIVALSHEQAKRILLSGCHEKQKPIGALLRPYRERPRVSCDLRRLNGLIIGEGAIPVFSDLPVRW